jgi:hypothetical protein
MNQPLDTSRQWIPIPPMDDLDNDQSQVGNILYAVVSDERLYAAHGGGLCKYLKV